MTKSKLEINSKTGGCLLCMLGVLKIKVAYVLKSRSNTFFSLHGFRTYSHGIAGSEDITAVRVCPGARPHSGDRRENVGEQFYAT